MCVLYNLSFKEIINILLDHLVTHTRDAMMEIKSTMMDAIVYVKLKMDGTVPVVTCLVLLMSVLRFVATERTLENILAMMETICQETVVMLTVN